MITKEQHKENLKIYLNEDFKIIHKKLSERQVEKVKPWFTNYDSLIIRLEGKHGKQYYLCKDMDSFFENCLFIVWQRYQSGYYFYEPEIPEEEKQLFTDEEISKLPEGEVKNVILRENSKNKQNLNQYKEDVNLHNKLMYCLDNRDGRIAYWMLEYRSDWEYEKFGIEIADIPSLPKGNLIKKDKKLEGSYFL